MMKDPERAEKLRRGKLLLKLRETLVHIRLDDEGDRIYLRSTNDADVLKAIIAEIDAYGWDEFMREKGDPDINIFEECRKANSQIAILTSSLTAAEARLGELEARLRAITNPSALAGSQAAKMIDPTLGPLTPIAMVVTKGQLQDARAALSQTEEGPR